MDERIVDHLKYLNRYYQHLLQVQQKPVQEFVEDDILQASTERFLQLAIESCLNIGNRLLALYQFQKPVSPPETYAGIFWELGRIGVFDPEFVQRLEQMAKFRNRLVHLYWELDPESVHTIVQDHLNDFKEFEKRVVSFCQENPLQLL